MVSCTELTLYDTILLVIILVTLAVHYILIFIQLKFRLICSSMVVVVGVVTTMGGSGYDWWWWL